MCAGLRETLARGRVSSSRAGRTWLWLLPSMMDLLGVVVVVLELVGVDPVWSGDGLADIPGPPSPLSLRIRHRETWRWRPLLSSCPPQWAEPGRAG